MLDMKTIECDVEFLIVKSLTEFSPLGSVPFKNNVWAFLEGEAPYHPTEHLKALESALWGAFDWPLREFAEANFECKWDNIRNVYVADIRHPRFIYKAEGFRNYVVSDKRPLTSNGFDKDYPHVGVVAPQLLADLNSFQY